nr:hypothetical protein [Glycomyces sp. NRRL B-16210]
MIRLHHELREAGQGELLPLVGEAAEVGTRAFQKFEQRPHRLPSLLHGVVVNRFEPFVDAGDPVTHLPHLLGENLLRPVGIADEVQVLALLLDEAGALYFELAAEALPDLPAFAGVGAEGLVCRVDGRLGKAKRRMVILDGGLHQLGLEPRQVATADKPTEAAEVEVHRATAVIPAVEVEPAAAASAFERAFERVVVHSLADTRGLLSFDDLLDLVEESLVDQGLVAAGRLLPLVDDVSEVVAIA